MFLCDLLYMMSDTDFAIYTESNTSCVLADATDEVVKRPETLSVKLFKQLTDNQIEANQNKCHLIVSKIKMYQCILVLLNSKRGIVRNCQESKKIVDLISISIQMIVKLTQKANRKTNALSRIRSFMNIGKRYIIKNSFFNSQFNYCLLVWMFHSR